MFLYIWNWNYDITHNIIVKNIMLDQNFTNSYVIFKKILFLNCQVNFYFNRFNNIVFLIIFRKYWKSKCLYLSLLNVLDRYIFMDV